MDRTQFVRDVYSQYWLTARDRIYGFLEYDKSLCRLIAELTPEGGDMLEVAIGTGYPIADFLQKAGFSVSGIDISPLLVQRCKELNPAIMAEVGDASNLRFADGSFDVAYCFHSTWLLPDVGRAVQEMLRVTRPGGTVLFDLLNRNNPAIAAKHDRDLRRLRGGLVPRAMLHARNVAKVVLRRGNPNWHAVLYETPTHPEAIYAQLRESGHEFTVLARNEDDQSLVRTDGIGPFPEYPRLIVVVNR